MRVRYAGIMRILVIADGVLARAGLAALLADVMDADVIGQVAPSPSLADDLDLYQPEAVVFDLGHDPTRWLGAVAALSAPSVLLLPDSASAYGVAAALPNGVRAALLLREGDPRRYRTALDGLRMGLVTLDTPVARALLPVGGGVDALVAEKLTQREAEVLQLMAAGLTNKAIAQALGISANTVKFHVNTILGKLGAQSRTEAVVRGGRLGLVLL
ncbi:MAG: response regulator transcription factor [Anaerolineae bacterium]|jgi:DNA-binding NarL/FixJ family response regulator|nr:response regulator transcription factor [Anaerolineae bacterium]